MRAEQALPTVNLGVLRAAERRVTETKDALAEAKQADSIAGQALANELHKFNQKWVFLRLDDLPGVYLQEGGSWSAVTLRVCMGFVSRVGSHENSRPVRTYVEVESDINETGEKAVFRIDVDTIQGGFICPEYGYQMLLKALLEGKVFDEDTVAELGFMVFQN